MIRVLFATLYLTISLLFAFQVRSEITDLVVAGFAVAILILAVWHARRVIRGAEGSPFRKTTEI